MSIICRISSLLILLLLLEFTFCDVIEVWPSNPDGYGPNTAENIQYPNANLSVPAPTTTYPDGPAGQGTVTTVTNFTNSVTSIITPPPSAMPGTCQIGNCTATASSVFVYYWPSESQNTACFSTLTDLSQSVLPPGFTPVSPSVYAIVVSFTASNGCSQVGIAHDTFTASFAPEELATVTWATDWTVTNSYTDAPCGPPGFDGQGKSYQPWFYAPHALFDQIGGPGYGGCIFPAWEDPSVRLVADNGIINGPNLPSKAKPRRHKRAGIEARTHTTMAVHSVDNGPINGPNPPLDRRAAAAAQGAPKPPAQTPDPAQHFDLY